MFAKYGLMGTSMTGSEHNTLTELLVVYAGERADRFATHHWTWALNMPCIQHRCHSTIGKLYISIYFTVFPERLRQYELLNWSREFMNQWSQRASLYKAIVRPKRTDSTEGELKKMAKDWRSNNCDNKLIKWLTETILNRRQWKDGVELWPGSW